MTVSPNRVVGSLVYRTREALNSDRGFRDRIASYRFRDNCLVSGKFNMWHYPGTHNEISEILREVNEHPNGSLVKFPNILDFMPVRQVISGEQTTLYLNLAICASTSSEWSTEQREQEVFDFVLRPVCDEFFRQIDRCGYFRKGYGAPSHNRYEVFTTGKNQGIILNRYGDNIDAIELHDLSLTLRDNLCEADIARINSENALVASNIKELLNN